jgi:hypothetical protein
VASPQDPARQQPRREAPRYREAAELALEQLEWCIGYLRQIRKPRIAKALEANRATIVKRYRL